MAGRLIYNDSGIMAYVAHSSYLRGFLPVPHPKYSTTYTVGRPHSAHELLMTWFRCECGVFRELDEVLHCPGGACEVCGRLFWEPEFPTAVRSAIRLDWRTAFALLLERQNGELVYPVFGVLDD